MAGWTFVLADQAGRQIAELAAESTLTFSRNGVPQVAPTLYHDQEESLRLLDVLENGGVPQLRAYRSGADSLKFSGVLDNINEVVESTGTLTPVFRGPFSRLLPSDNGGGRFTSATRVFAFTDQGLIAWTMIDEANADSPTGIALGDVELSIPRDRVYEHKSVGEAIVELTEVIGGFDFDVAPLDPRTNGGALGAFNVYRHLGVDRPDVLFDFGPGTGESVQSVRRVTRLPINRVRALGSDSLAVEAEDAASIAKFGLYMQVLTASDVVDAATLTAKATGALRPEPVRVVEFTPEPELAPQPWDDYWLGDTVRLHARFGYRDGDRQTLDLALAPRVNVIEITTDDNGLETAHTLTIDEGI